MEKHKALIIWKTSDRRAKHSENWDSHTAYIEYLLPCSVQGHFGVIHCTCDFSKNTIFKMLLLLHLNFFYKQTLYSCSF